MEKLLYEENGRYPEKLSELRENIFPTQREPDAVIIDFDYTASGDSFVLRAKLPGKSETIQIEGRQGRLEPSNRRRGQQAAGADEIPPAQP